ncbi:hypothetical protein K501DRAFT_267461 [Backusella circina FSU 941]|nr:hypothetical protein K501DRAFT_267461 [Backusella circina FSU 941]
MKKEHLFDPGLYIFVIWYQKWMSDQLYKHICKWSSNQFEQRTSQRYTGNYTPVLGGFTTVKTSVQEAGFSNNHINTLRQLINDFEIVATQAANMDFDIEIYINPVFFMEKILTGYQRLEFSNVTQMATFQSHRMVAEYSNVMALKYERALHGVCLVNAALQEIVSIKEFGVFGHLIKFHNSDVPFGSFMEKLWTEKLDTDLNEHGEAFSQIINYSLTTFHLVSRALTISLSNHERAYFVENIIPFLLALGKLTKFLEFKWCETEFSSSKIMNLKDFDYDLHSAPRAKLIDVLGTLTTQNNMDLIIVEFSSGISEENTNHYIEYTLNTLECAVASHRKEAAHYQQASLETLKQLKVYGIHVIKT